MNVHCGKDQASPPEKLIAESIVDVATELRLIDAAELMFMIRNDHQANISDLVNSSSELYFKSGTLKFGLTSGCEVDWDSSPTISLDMEFGHKSVFVFFRLMLGRRRAGVEVMNIIFDEPGLSCGAQNARLLAAISEARLPSRNGGSSPPPSLPRGLDDSPA